MFVPFVNRSNSLSEAFFSENFKSEFENVSGNRLFHNSKNVKKEKKMREISQTFCKIQECQNWTKMREISQTFGKLQKNVPSYIQTNT
jgi:hypothetical protein